MKNKLLFLITLIMTRNTISNIFMIMILNLTIISCNNEKAIKQRIEEDVKQEIEKDHKKPENTLRTLSPVINDTIAISKIHKPSAIFCDLDGDLLSDTVQIVQHKKNRKYGLKVIFGSKKIEYLGMGTDILGQGFNDLDWVGIFEKAPKGEIYWNNVNDEGEIITEEAVKESDKIKLLNDGIFIHQSESCGGGVIYWKNGKFEWIQQE